LCKAIDVAVAAESVLPALRRADTKPPKFPSN
jgi:hypothetical protein